MVGIPSNGGNILDPSLPVGVHYLPATDKHPPLRIFYPALASLPKDGKKVGWFQETGVAPYLMGYLHTIRVVTGNSLVSRWLVQPCVTILTWILPMTWLKLPGVYQDALPINTNDSAKSSRHDLPLIIFSHGLTGTGQENAALCAAWAQQGRVVVSVHHTDGSSCRVPLKDGTVLYYQHGPPMTEYDASFRPRQVQVRAKEVFQARNFMVTENDDDDTSSALLNQIRQLVDPQRVVAAGYSYGAATVAQAVVMTLKPRTSSSSLDDDSDEDEQEEKKSETFPPTTQQTRPLPPFQAAIFLDGWFHIDVQESAGIEFELPPEAFEYLKHHDETWPIPSLFINSQQFQGYTKLYQATERLASAAANTSTTTDNDNDNTRPEREENITVLPETGHQNFCDVIFWLPHGLLRKMMMGAIGTTDPLLAYQEMVRHSQDFLQVHVGNTASTISNTGNNSHRRNDE